MNALRSVPAIWLRTNVSAVSKTRAFQRPSWPSAPGVKYSATICRPPRLQASHLDTASVRKCGRLHDTLMKFNNLDEHRIKASSGARPTKSSAELMSDSAIYRRTTQGQRELLRVPDPAATPALRLLARLNGYTDLRRLIDMAPGDARELGKAIEQLFNDGLIELVDLSM